MKLRRLHIVALVLLVVWTPVGMHYSSLEWWGYGIIILFQLGVLVYGCMNIQSQYFMPVLCSARTDEPVVALTFDDGPHPAYTPRILETLSKYRAPATFFCIGKNVTANNQLLADIHRNGHLVGNHSYSHDFWFDMFRSKKMLADMQQMDKAAMNTLAVKPLLFRPPYGVMNPNLRSAIIKGKYVPVGWSIRSLDTSIKDKQKLLSRITAKLSPGDVILLHDTMQITADILPELIETIQKKGFKIKRLDEMLNVKAYA